MSTWETTIRDFSGPLFFRAAIQSFEPQQKRSLDDVIRFFRSVRLVATTSRRADPLIDDVNAIAVLAQVDRCMIAARLIRITTIHPATRNRRSGHDRRIANHGRAFLPRRSLRRSSRVLDERYAMVAFAVKPTFIQLRAIRSIRHGGLLSTRTASTQRPTVRGSLHVHRQKHNGSVGQTEFSSQANQPSNSYDSKMLVLKGLFGLDGQAHLVEHRPAIVIDLHFELARVARL